jgi:glycosyltransferase involved in cell wall biosynthesis
MSIKNKISFHRNSEKKQGSSGEYENGISVIIPSYKAENHIRPLLDSLEKQTLDPARFDLIFILNGELDSTIYILEDFMKGHPEMNVLVAFTSVGGVSNARNLGLSIAKRQFVTFVDDDDFISPNYLKKLYDHSKPDRIVMTNFMDVIEETGEKIESRVVPFSVSQHGVIENAYVDFQSLINVTVAKIIPTYAAKTVKFNTALRSGVDVSYYSRLYARYDFEFYFIDKKEQATYYRIIRSGSISRQNMTFDFNVIQRLAVIDDINIAFDYTDDEIKTDYLKLRTLGQCSFMIRYLREYPEDKQRVLDEIEKHNLKYFPYEKLP